MGDSMAKPKKSTNGFPGAVYIAIDADGSLVVAESPQEFLDETEEELMCARYRLESVVKLRRVVAAFDEGDRMVEILRWWRP